MIEELAHFIHRAARDDSRVVPSGQFLLFDSGRPSLLFSRNLCTDQSI